MGAYKYTLTDPLEYWVSAKGAPRYRGEWLRIWTLVGNAVIVVSNGYSWDGCTAVPDARGTKEASCLHDAIYQFSEEIAEQSGMTLRQVLRWGDGVFLQRMLDGGAKIPVAVLYYIGVRVAGYPFHVGARTWRRIFG